jgi:hypothetical protein
MQTQPQTQASNPALAKAIAEFEAVMARALESHKAELARIEWERT